MQQEDSDEEEKTQRSGRLSSVQAQRLPIFPGMDHSVLKVSEGRMYRIICLYKCVNKICFALHKQSYCCLKKDPCSLFSLFRPSCGKDTSLRVLGNQVLLSRSNPLNHSLELLVAEYCPPV